MLVEKAYLELYPQGQLGKYSFSLKYSGRFKGYNANVKQVNRSVTFHLSRKWENIEDDVKIGLIQELFAKLWKTKKRTQNMDLYELFLKKVHIAVPKTKNHPVLEASFNRMNEKFFQGMMERPNLVWGKKSFNKLGSYEYGSDTITMSTIFEQAPIELLDYVMYHEMLHKKHKWKTSKGRNYHHTKEFLADERKYPNYAQMERKLGELIRKHKYKKSFLRFF